MLNPLSFISKIFKSGNDIELAKFRKILEKINSLENNDSTQKTKETISQDVDKENKKEST